MPGPLSGAIHDLTAAQELGQYPASCGGRRHAASGASVAERTYALAFGSRFDRSNGPGLGVAPGHRHQRAAEGGVADLPVAAGGADD